MADSPSPKFNGNYKPTDSKSSVNSERTQEKRRKLHRGTWSLFKIGGRKS